MDRHHHNAHRAGLAAPEGARVVPAGLAPLGAPGAAAAGLIPPQVGAPLPIGVGERRDKQQGSEDKSIVADDMADDQAGAIDTLRARLALSAVEAFADRVGAPR